MPKDVRLAIPLEWHARLTQRSWWRLKYTDGRIIDEREVDWSLAPVRGRQQLELVCPNGQTARLGNTQDATGRLFQFKQSVAAAYGVGRTQLAHVIGIIHGTDGQATLMAWDYDKQAIVGPYEDNANAVGWGNVGALSADHLAIRPD